MTFAHQAHGVTGILESASLNIALLLLPLALWRNPGWRGFSKWSVALGSVYMIGNGVIAVQYIFGIEGLGITQRFQLLSFSEFSCSSWTSPSADFPRKYSDQGDRRPAANQ